MFCLISIVSEKPVLECPFAHLMIVFLSHLVKNSIYRVSVICKLAMKWYLMRMCASSFKGCTRKSFPLFFRDLKLKALTDWSLLGVSAISIPESALQFIAAEIWPSSCSMHRFFLVEPDLTPCYRHRDARRASQVI